MIEAVLLNLALVSCIAGALVLSPDWFQGRPRMAALGERLRTAVVLFLLLLPALPLVRRTRAAFIAEDAIQLSHAQVPELYAILEAHCRKLGMRVPELLLSSAANVPGSCAFAFRGGRRIIVLGAKLLSGLGQDLSGRRDAFAFVLGHELGRLALGHAGFGQELLLGYMKHVPVLTAPLLRVQARSRDRYGAFLAPDGVRGLLLQAVGAEALDHLDISAFLDQVMGDHYSLWAQLGALRHGGAPVGHRVRALYRAGFFDLQRDRARFAAVPCP